MEISVRETAEVLRRDKSVKLIDVRTKEEYDIAHIEGSLLVDGDEKIQEVLKWPKNTPIIVHCHHGPRSSQAVSFLKEQGFENVKNMTNGIDAWSIEVDPKVPQY